MGKRLFLAVALSFLVLFIWSQWAIKTQPIANNTVTSITPPLPQLATIPPSSASNIGIDPLPSSKSPRLPVPTLKFTGKQFDLFFDVSRGAIQEVVFKAHQNHKLALENAFVLADETLVFSKEYSGEKEIVFVHTDTQKKITKKFLIDNSRYAIELEIIIQNLSSAPISVKLPLILGTLDFAGQKEQARYCGVMVSGPEKTLYLNSSRELSWPVVNFLGLHDKYFCAIIQPATGALPGFMNKINTKGAQIGLELPGESIPPKSQIGHKFQLYLGPQEAKLLNQLNPAWAQIMHYGTFNLISHLLLQLLAFFYKLVHNWGVAIILLSLAVYLLLYPLTLKQMRSMKEMNLLKPHMEELRKLYKDNPQRLNKEIMELYKKHKVNPLGGCLPLVLQIPIFFALYQALMRSIALKGAKFLWIKDLSEPDRIFILPMSLPILGNEVNILPIIMAVLMLFQQKSSMATAGGGSGEQEKIMLIVFPIMFGFIFYRMPSGLVLYWLVNSALMLFYQLRVIRAK